MIRSDFAMALLYRVLLVLLIAALVIVPLALGGTGSPPDVRPDLPAEAMPALGIATAET